MKVSIISKQKGEREIIAVCFWQHCACAIVWTYEPSALRLSSAKYSCRFFLGELTFTRVPASCQDSCETVTQTKQEAHQLVAPGETLRHST